MPFDKEFGKYIADLLRSSGFSFETEKPVGGVIPDFTIETADGRLFVVEAKSWEKSPGFTKHAAQQVRLYQEAIGADGAFVVIQGLQRSRLSDGVVTADRLVTTLQKEFEKTEVPKKQHTRGIGKKEKTIFAAMPFGLEYEDVYFVAMAPAAESANMACKRVDREDFSGDIVEKIKQMIRECVAVIIDLSESKPNVLYEAGYAHALERPTIHICSTPLNELPFDVSHWNTIEYHKGQTHKLAARLEKRLKAILA